MRPGKGRREGFTLIEILVVIAILSVLSGLVLAGVNAAQKHAHVRATGQEILALVQAAENYNNARGDYPPSALSALKLKRTSVVNEGNRALLLSLLGRKKGGPFLQDLKEDRLANAGGDSLSAAELASLKKDLDIPQATPKLLEYIDMWGNPFVYIHNRDYKRAKNEYLDRDGNRVAVKAAWSEKLGTFQNPNSYQIWSFGPNGKNENGEGDDVASWK